MKKKKKLSTGKEAAQTIRSSLSEPRLDADLTRKKAALLEQLELTRSQYDAKNMTKRISTLNFFRRHLKRVLKKRGKFASLGLENATAAYDQLQGWERVLYKQAADKINQSFDELKQKRERTANEIVQSAFQQSRQSELGSAGSETESLHSDLPQSENSLMVNQPDRSMTHHVAAVAKSAHHANDLRAHNRLNNGKRHTKAMKRKYAVHEDANKDFIADDDAECVEFVLRRDENVMINEH
jgi:hypothetical protein